MAFPGFPIIGTSPSSEDTGMIEADDEILATSLARTTQRFEAVLKISPVPVETPQFSSTPPLTISDVDCPASSSSSSSFSSSAPSLFNSPNAPARAKIPLEKGYSQMVWMRLMRNEPDLAGLKGQSPKRLLTMDDIKHHKGEDEAWTVLRGRVYNISPYLKFHPGGKDMLMRAAGKDCTALFNKYHAWVNAEFLLEKCLVGFLDVPPRNSKHGGNS